jgi:tetratricopeptide (TPR) repeat protein
MTLSDRHGNVLNRAVLLAAWLLIAPAVAPALPSQAGGDPAFDLAAQEAQLEALWATALELSPETDPMHVLQAWGVLFQSEVMVDRMRAVAAGVEQPSTTSAGDAYARALERWRRERPGDGGPDLFEALRDQEPESQRRAVVALLDRHPDDALVIWQAALKLDQAGEHRRALEILEGFLIRNPERPVAYRLLANHHGRAENQTEQARVLRGWAAVAPGDPDLVSRWLGSPLARAELEETAALLDRFFAAAPSGNGAPQACLRAAQAMPAYAGRARSCLDRLAATPDGGLGIAQRATQALAQLAAVGEGSGGLETALGRLAPETRFRATIEAAYQLKAPDRCGERIALLRTAMEEVVWDSDRPGRVASALSGCAKRPEAEALFLELVRRAPTSRLDRVIGGWAMKVNGVWMGDLPVETVQPLLEARLASEADSEKLFWALDVVYQLGGDFERRLELLRRWHETLPATLGAEQAIALADALLFTGAPEEALRLLERQLEHRFAREVAEELWALYLATGDAAGAEHFARELIDGGERGKAATGHLLAARSAVVGQEPGKAEKHYWAYLQSDFPAPEVAAELMALVGSLDQPGRLPELARRICEETGIGRGRGDSTRCAADLLAKTGSPEAAAGMLAERAAELPDDLPALRELARTAGAAGRPDLAEQALRRILELDPAGRDGWVGLAVFLERQHRHGELEELLGRARGSFDPAPPQLMRAVARGRLAAGDPRQAIDLLQEARRDLPADNDPSWIDNELRHAYAALGREQR